MEGLSLSEIAAAHPEAQVCSVDGVLHAFIPDGRGGGAETYAYTEQELAAKLAAG